MKIPAVGRIAVKRELSLLLKARCPVRGGPFPFFGSPFFIVTFSFFFSQNNHRLLLARLAISTADLAYLPTLAEPTAPGGLFPHRRKIWHRPISRVFIPTNHAGAVRGTRFADKLELSARRTSIVISIARTSVHPLARSARELSSGHTAEFADICGYTVCAQSLLRSADSKTANTRLGATKPQTKANTIAAGVSRAYVVSMSDQRRKLCKRKKRKE